MNGRLFFCGPVLLVWLCCARCGLAASAEAFSSYGPLHPGPGVPVTFQVDATSPSGILRVELSVFEYEWQVLNLTAQRAGGLWGTQKVWLFPGKPGSVKKSFEVTGGFPAHSFVSFIFDVVDGAGQVTTEYWGFAAGGWNFGKTPIPVWIVPPETGDATGLLASTPTPIPERLHMLFMAQENDPKYPQPRDMLPDLSEMIFDHFMPANCVRIGRKHWAFHYSPERAFIPPFEANEKIEVTQTQYSTTNQPMRVGVIVHSEEFTDWRVGHFVGTEPGAANFGTLLHEVGHGVFDLSDEYKTDPEPRVSAAYFHNVYASEWDCVLYLWYNRFEDVGDYRFDRYPIPGTSRWKVEHDNTFCVMRVGKHGPAGIEPHFSKTCMGRARWIYSLLP